MTVKLMVTQCSFCQTVSACTIHGSVITLRTECDSCEKDGLCAVVENKELFEISHGICTTCMEYHYK